LAVAHGRRLSAHKIINQESLREEILSIPSVGRGGGGGGRGPGYGEKDMADSYVRDHEIAEYDGYIYMFVWLNGSDGNAKKERG
jgi:hypothetical protein